MNILQLIEQKGITPKRVSANKGGEYHSPCPACGGENRFHIWPEQSVDGSFWCRGCDKGGDAVAYLRLYEGMSCGAAHASLGRECVSATCPKIGTCRQGKGSGGVRNEGATAAVRKHRGMDWKPSEAHTPTDLWREHAEKLVAAAHETLLSSPEKLAYLAGRGLPLEAVRHNRLGWLEKDTYRARESWGLPTELNKDKKPKKLWLPKGIVIPYSIDGELHRLRIRRDELQNPDDARYYWVPGSGNDVVVINPSARAFVVVESDLDGLMIDHAAGDLVGAVPLGTCSAKPKETATQILRASLAIPVALDFEPRQNQQTGRMENPGGQAAKWWSSTFPQAYRWPPPAGKDPGEAYTAGVDIRAWILAGLPPAMTIISPLRDKSPDAETAQLPAVATPGVSSTNFDQDKAQQLISDTYSLIFSRCPNGAIDWIERERPDVFGWLKQAEKAIESALDTRDHEKLVKNVAAWRRYHLRAFDIFEARPPVIQVEPELVPLPSDVGNQSAA